LVIARHGRERSGEVIRAVIDTNVLVSGLLSPAGNERDFPHASYGPTRVSAGETARPDYV
jgi:hypothetical protein